MNRGSKLLLGVLRLTLALTLFLVLIRALTVDNADIVSDVWLYVGFSVFIFLGFVLTILTVGFIQRKMNRTSEQDTER